MAQWAAVRYSADHVFDYVEMTRDHSIFETQVPAAWIGKTIVELAVRQKYRKMCIRDSPYGSLPSGGVTGLLRRREDGEKRRRAPWRGGGRLICATPV